MTQENIIIAKNLRQITDMLLLNGTLSECPGLVHGKMGIVVFFLNYAKYTGNNLFSDYAMDVIGEMLNQIQKEVIGVVHAGIKQEGVSFDTPSLLVMRLP